MPPPPALLTSLTTPQQEGGPPGAGAGAGERAAAVVAAVAAAAVSELPPLKTPLSRRRSSSYPSPLPSRASHPTPLAQRGGGASAAETPPRHASGGDISELQPSGSVSKARQGLLARDRDLERERGLEEGGGRSLRGVSTPPPAHGANGLSSQPDPTRQLWDRPPPLSELRAGALDGRGDHDGEEARAAELELKLRRSHRRQQRRTFDSGADLRRDGGIRYSADPRIANFGRGAGSTFGDTPWARLKKTNLGELQSLLAMAP